MRGVFGLVVCCAIGLPALGALAAEEAAPAPKIYTCKDADGNTVYQDDPCSVVKPAPKPVAPAPPKTQAPAKSKSTTSTKPAAKPPVAAKPAPAAVKPPVAPKSSSGSKGRGVVLPSLKLPPPPGGTIDSRWATPEATLRTFVAAVSSGDRTLAVSCLTSYALGDLGPSPEQFPLEALQETVSSFTGYAAEGDLGPFWAIRALRDGQRPKWIFFERTGSGEWKIGGI